MLFSTEERVALSGDSTLSFGWIMCGWGVSHNLSLTLLMACQALAIQSVAG